MDELLSEHNKILTHTRTTSQKSAEGQVTPIMQTEEEKLCLVGARCLSENHPELITRQARLLQRLQVDRIGVFRSPTSFDQSSAGSVHGRTTEPPRRPYHALLTHYPTQRRGPRPNGRTGGSGAATITDSSAGEASYGRLSVDSSEPRQISVSSSASTTVVNSRSHHSVVRRVPPQQSRQPGGRETAGTGPGQGGRQPQASRKAAADAERVNRFVSAASRPGNVAKR